MQYWILDKDGKTPIELPEGVWPEGKPTTRVARDVLGNGKVVSTVFLTIDHGYMDAEPVLFETMVFPNENDFGDIDGDRYTSYDLAVAGHNRMVKEHSKTENTNDF